jgi:hypothetical protein
LWCEVNSASELATDDWKDLPQELKPHEAKFGQAPSSRRSTSYIVKQGFEARPSEKSPK